LYEVVNVTELAVRKGRITEDKARAFLDSLADLPTDRSRGRPRGRSCSHRFSRSSDGTLTAYDASYLELAIRHDLPIAALDNALSKAAREPA
jgi:predicted nucleic acid-binding protein